MAPDAGTKQDEQPGLVQKALIWGAREGLKTLLPDPLDGTDEEPAEPQDRLSRFATRVLEEPKTHAAVEEYLGRQIRDQVVSFGTRLRENTYEVLLSLANRFDPDNQDSYELIRQRIAPKGGFLKTIAARALWVGAKVGTFVTAILIDRFSGRDEAESNRPHIERIFAGLLGKRKPITAETPTERKVVLAQRKEQKKTTSRRAGRALLPPTWFGQPQAGAAGA